MSERTQGAYIHHVYHLAKYFGLSPDKLSDEQVREYLFHLARERKLSASTVNQAVNAFRFFYDHVVHREVEALRRALPPDTIVTLDAGAAPAYGYDRLHFTKPRTFLTPLDLGGLGFAFPVALGAKLGRPGAPVLAIHGDGGFLMNAQEIETAMRHGINTVTLVMNNNCWGSEKAYQKHFYAERYIGCDIGNPRYDAFARLFGAAGYYVDQVDQIGDVIRTALAGGVPAIVEVPIDPDEFPTPATAARKTPAARPSP